MTQNRLVAPVRGALAASLLVLLAAAWAPAAMAADEPTEATLHWESGAPRVGAPDALLLHVPAAAPAPADDGHSHSHGGHMMHTNRTIAPGETAPGVAIEVLKDLKAGYNLRVLTTDFRWAPWNASTMHVPGEGHAHLYVDGTKIGRLYGEWTFLGKLAPGEHVVRVTLNSNAHEDYVVNGSVIEDSATFTVPDETMAAGSGTGMGDGHTHSHGAHMMHTNRTIAPGETAPGVVIEVLKDLKAGYNLRVTTTDFRWAPWNASTDHVPGEGHAHLYVDGTKVTRLYGEWYNLGTLTPGEHVVRVTLNSNAHEDYVIDGSVVESLATVGVPDPEAPPHLRLVLRTTTGDETLELAAHELQPGQYRIPYDPSTAGTIEARLLGTIQGLPVDEALTLSPVDPAPEPEPTPDADADADADEPAASDAPATTTGDTDDNNPAPERGAPGPATALVILGLATIALTQRPPRRR